MEFTKELFYKELEENNLHFPNSITITRGCSANSLLLIRQKFVELKVKELLEIGTFYGVSSLIFASWGIRVHTMDIRERPEQVQLWKTYNVEHLIKFYKITEDRGKTEEIVKTLDVDLVYIDGSHHYDNVKADFEMVKPYCSRVLFHDYLKLHFPSVYRLCEEIGATRVGWSLALWEKK